MREHACFFGADQTLVGVVTDPPQGSAARVGAIFLNAGVIHRVGPSRLYVRLARELASLECVSVRFDHSGVGDSPARRDTLAFEESAILEARTVMDSMQRARGIDRFLLVGLCSGAVTAFEAAVVDDRVAGAVLINPQGFDENAAWNRYIQNRGHARRYWTRSLFSASSWWHVLTGRVDYRRLLTVLWRQAAGAVASDNEAVSSVASRVAANLRTLLERRVAVLLLCSEGDDGIDYMNVILGRDVRRLPGSEGLSVRILPAADHSCTLRESQRRIVDAIRQWAAAFVGDARDEAPARAPVESQAQSVSVSF